MVQALIACVECGYVAQKASFVGARRICPECHSKMEPVSLERARELVRRRRAKLNASSSSSP